MCCHCMAWHEGRTRTQKEYEQKYGAIEWQILFPRKSGLSQVVCVCARVFCCLIFCCEKKNLRFFFTLLFSVIFFCFSFGIWFHLNFCFPFLFALSHTITNGETIEYVYSFFLSRRIIFTPNIYLTSQPEPLILRDVFSFSKVLCISSFNHCSIHQYTGGSVMTIDYHGKFGQIVNHGKFIFVEIQTMFSHLVCTQFLRLFIWFLYF